MTTGRINQISRFTPRGDDSASRSTPARARKRPRMERQDVNELSWKGRTSAQPRRQRPGAPGDRNVTIQVPPLKAPRAPVRTQRIPPGERPHGRRRTAAYGPQEGGPDPVDNADERRIPRGGSPRESRYRDWPAANDPQTPTVPGTQRSPGFGHPSARRGPTPSVIKPVKAARGRTATRLRWATCPRSRGGGHARSEPNAPPVTERQPAWQGRRKKRAPEIHASPVRRRLPAVPRRRRALPSVRRTGRGEDG